MLDYGDGHVAPASRTETVGLYQAVHHWIALDGLNRGNTGRKKCGDGLEAAQRRKWERLAERVTRVLTAPGDGVLPFGEEGGVQRYRRRYVCRLVAEGHSCYSVGTRDPFEGHRWPLWLRFRRDTADFRGIVMRLESSGLKGEAVNSDGHLWFELELPQDSERLTFAEVVDDLVKQVKGILAVAYPQ